MPHAKRRTDCGTGCRNAIRSREHPDGRRGSRGLGSLLECAASRGAVAQLGERRVRNAKVGSSILLRSTTVPLESGAYGRLFLLPHHLPNNEKTGRSRHGPRLRPLPQRLAGGPHGLVGIAPGHGRQPAQDHGLAVEIGQGLAFVPAGVSCVIHVAQQRRLPAQAPGRRPPGKKMPRQGERWRGAVFAWAGDRSQRGTFRRPAAPPPAEPYSSLRARS